MIIILDTDDKDKALRLSESLEDPTVLNEKPWADLASRPEDNYVFFGKNLFDNSPEDRLIQFVLANQGSLLFSDDKVSSPMFAGEIPVSAARCKVHVNYALSRAETFRIEKVKYSGTVLEDPKNVIFLPNFRDPAKNLETIYKVLSVAPGDWWASLGFVQTSSLPALSNALNDQLYYSHLIGLHQSTVSRFEFLDREDGLIDASDLDLNSPRSGILLRERSYRPTTFTASAEPMS